MKRITTLLLALLALPFQSLHAGSVARPNIIFILADDLGMDGVSCTGGDVHKTPNIDKLAASGTRFETCYAAPLCGPSRCLLMTGRYATAGICFRARRTGNGQNGDGRRGVRGYGEWFQVIGLQLHLADFAGVSPRLTSEKQPPSRYSKANRGIRFRARSRSHSF